MTIFTKVLTQKLCTILHKLTNKVQKFLQLPIILSQLHAAVVFIVSLNVHLDCWETPLQHRVLPVACVA